MARPRIRQSKRAQIDVLVGCVETLAFDAEAADARDSAHEIDVDRSSESVPRPSARLTAATSANSLRFASVAGQPGTRSSNSICARLDWRILGRATLVEPELPDVDSNHGHGD